MSSEAVFAGIYATLVVLAAVVLDRVGRARLRTGTRVPSLHEPTWPNLASVTLHTAVASVAAVAGLLVAAVVAVRHHGAADLGVLAVPAVLAALTIRRCYRRLREAAAAEAAHV